MTLRECRDPIMRATEPTVATRRKWNAAIAVEEAIAVLRHRDIVDNVQHGRGGLGLGIAPNNCKREEAARCVRAVLQASQARLLDEVGWSGTTEDQME